MNIVYGNKVVILMDNARGTLLKFLGVLLSPPLVEIAFGIELAAFVVESVRELVANYGGRVAVVNGIVHLQVIERRLQNAGGKIDVVHLRIVISVDRRRGHAPLAPVNRLADLGNLPVRLKFCPAKQIAEGIAA